MLLSSDPTVGFTNITASSIDGNPKCSFNRAKNMTNVTHYFNINNKYYILVAFGSLSSSDTIKKHITKGSSPNQFNFLKGLKVILRKIKFIKFNFYLNLDDSYSSNSDTNPPDKVKIHACLMVNYSIYLYRVQDTFITSTHPKI